MPKDSHRVHADVSLYLTAPAGRPELGVAAAACPADARGVGLALAKPNDLRTHEPRREPRREPSTSRRKNSVLVAEKAEGAHGLVPGG